MKNISFTGLRARLILFVLIIMFPVLGLVVYHGIESRNKDRLEALDKARRLARNAAILYEHTIMDTRQILFTLSQMPQFREQDPDACSKILADLLEQTESYSGFAAAKPNGEVFASAPSLAKPVSFADRPWFQRLVQTRSSVIGEYSIGRISGKPIVVLGYPVLDRTGRLMTVITAGLDLERLQQTLLKITLPDEATLNVIDSHGTILLRFPDPEEFLGKKMHDKSIVKTMLTKRDGTEEGVGLGGVPRLYGYTTVGSGIEAIHISVGIPEQVAYATVKRHMVRDLALLGLVSALALLGAWLFGNILIISPVNRLIGVTKRVAEGDLTVRTGQSDVSGELGLLASNFDRMAESLQRREEERKLAEEALRESERRLSEIIDFLPDATFAIDGEGKVIMWNHEIEEMTGVKAEYMLGKGNYEYSLPFYGSRKPILIDLVLETDEEIEKKYRFIEKKGDIYFAEADVPLNNQNRVLSGKARPLYDGRGNVSGAIESIRDITERKLAEEALLQNEEQYRALVENIDFGVTMIDKDFKIIMTNAVLGRWFNKPARDFAGKNCFREFEKRQAVCPHCPGVNAMATGRPHQAETEGVRNDGSRFSVLVHAFPLFYPDGATRGFIEVVEDITERKLAEGRLKRQVDHLAALRSVDMAITASLDIRVTFSIFLEQVINNLHVDAADVLVLNSHSYNKLTFVAGRGFRTNALRYTNLSIGEGFAGRVARERKTLCIPDLEKDAQDLLKISPQISSEDFVAYYGAPLIAKGQVKGVLEIFNRTPLEPDQEWLDFLEALTTQAAIAADNAMLFDDLQRSNLDLIQAYDSTLEGWSNALDLRDKETEGHSRRVTEMTLRMARQMGMRDSELVHVRRGALLHDIGKMGIPDGILLKPGPLNDEEWEIMRKHPESAYELLYPISYLRPALDIPYSHHEKWDGTGYPCGLKAEHIPLAARIFSIVDVWDALCSDRPYRTAWPEEKAREHIREQTGKHFDPKVVEAFLELLNEFKPV